MQTSQAHSVRQREAFQIAWIHLFGDSLDPQQEGILFDIKASPASYQNSNLFIALTLLVSSFGG